MLSLNFPLTLGQFTVAFSLLLILIQLIILRRNFKLEHILQIPVSILFGYFIDLTMRMLFFIEPSSYVSSLIYLLIGCLILGFGVYAEVLANVAMLPGESFVRAVCFTWKTDFDVSKIAFDVSLTVIAALLSVLFARRLDRVREGTVIAALLVGFIARIFSRKLSFLGNVLFASSADLKATVSHTAEISEPAFAPVIVIGRQYGSGGHNIGKALAKKLGYEFYDEEIIQMTAGSTGYEPQFIREQEESMTNSLFYDLIHQMYVYSDTQNAPHDAIFESEGKVIRELASRGNCVIVGRCADYFLRSRPNTWKFFIHAPESYRMKHVMETEHLSREDALQKIRRVNRRRSDNYRYYTHRIWGRAKYYNLTVDASIGTNAVLSVLMGFLQAEKLLKKAA